MVSRLAMPLRVLPTGQLATVVQDSPADVAQSLALLITTRPGDRRVVPDYGIPDPLFAGADPSAIADAVEAWEPRADPLLIDRLVDGDLQVVDLATTLGGDA